jgi:sulfite reductase alpha subunit-like flavoprotein
MNKSYAASLLVVATTAGSNNLSYASTDLAERLAAAQTALERAVERDLGLNAAQLRTYQKVEERAIRLRAKLIETQGGDYAGVFIKRNPAGVYRVVANGKNQADIKANPNETPDETRSVKYSLDDLREFNKRLVAHFVATSLISKINSIGINVEENRLDVRATKLHIGVVRAGVATSSIPQDAARLI